jgi:hypothetical protein
VVGTGSGAPFALRRTMKDEGNRRGLEEHGWEAKVRRRPRQARRRPREARRVPASAHPRFAAGADAMQTFEAKANTLLTEGQANRELSTSLAYDDAAAKCCSMAATASLIVHLHPDR